MQAADFEDSRKIVRRSADFTVTHRIRQTDILPVIDRSLFHPAQVPVDVAEFLGQHIVVVSGTADHRVALRLQNRFQSPPVLPRSLEIGHLQIAQSGRMEPQRGIAAEQLLRSLKPFFSLREISAPDVIKAEALIDGELLIGGPLGQRRGFLQRDERRIGHVQLQRALRQRSVLRRQVDVVDAVVFEHLDLAAEVVVSHPPRALRQVEVAEHPVAGGDAFGVIVVLGFGEHLAGLVNRRVGLVLLDIIGNQAARPDEIIEIAQVFLGMLAAEFLHALHPFEDFRPVVLVVEMVETDAKRDSLHPYVARGFGPPEERVAHCGGFGIGAVRLAEFVIRRQSAVRRL